MERRERALKRDGERERKKERTCVRGRDGHREKRERKKEREKREGWGGGYPPASASYTR